ncbi:uncharacterized protein MONOS_10459 [Monocercomonoides exilis]|uniref:uncharacterized protein n=1 Tax=Monocercomonoides exilis TaxID=2049356 RepID=UPI00355A2891|nr:hypothetical protein MONOS_10459 [Monocercomonoides exilis]|eukprot:MONOS_10459.1-p1 / transcript=MONOS_10459.1 / gene=MONOS_10459 / organism=Monocercomonoides_exilis_PA203 / gene_product=unspecified product / transcript_product=unspecified product / location=Mono_scaffold00477:8445-9906(+) / protein_length=443 / sequence_SO=supercontig / SO=protein_coding / is_pseudo=false
MKAGSDDETEDGIQESPIAHKILKLFCELEDCNEEDQKQKVLKMSGLVEEMGREEFNSAFTTGLFNRMNKMIEEEKLSMRNVCLLLKHVGYCIELKSGWSDGFLESLLIKRIEEMLIDENEKKKEEKDENLFVDLCECYFSLSYYFSGEVLSICVSCLLKASSNKEENVEVQKEVEMALLALSNTEYYKIGKNQYLKEMLEIMQHHQEHRNLTHLAYQSAWKFLIKRVYNDESLEEMIVNELHFAREAARELEELVRCVDWTRKGDEICKREKKRAKIIIRWLDVIYEFLRQRTLWNEEFVGLISSIVQVYRASRDNHSEISYLCIYSLRTAAENRNVKVENLLKGEAFDAVLEEIHRSTLDDKIAHDSLIFFMKVSRRLKEKTDGETDERKRKAMKMKLFEKMEEEGYEEAITSFHEIFDFLNEERFTQISSNISYYFINI